MDARQLNEGDLFQITQFGKVYVFIGITVNGTLIYQGSRGLYDRKSTKIFQRVPLGSLSRVKYQFA